MFGRGSTRRNGGLAPRGDIGRGAESRELRVVAVRRGCGMSVSVSVPVSICRRGRRRREEEEDEEEEDQEEAGGPKGRGSAYGYIHHTPRNVPWHATAPLDNVQMLWEVERQVNALVAGCSTRGRYDYTHIPYWASIHA